MVDNPTPSAKEVDQFHRNSDLDQRPESQHHSIGKGSNQVSSGRHTHNGADSLYLLPSTPITGSRSADTDDVVHQILTALTAIGLVDGTSA